ncbi:hypothetical protein BMS3Bbin10_02481 [bacterium BMS3Bbin10]|nr:hypothetical protein BMS3Bbin10_02481 [bacterium BMS3Bbin10]
MKNPWKWTAAVLGLLLLGLLVFTVLVVNGVMELSLSVF